MFVFDIETDSIDANLIHCLCYHEIGSSNNKFLTDYNEIREFVQQKDIILIGHNIVRFDIPTIERLLSIKIDCQLIDTLPLSWYLFVKQPRHGLEQWGEYFGVPKVKVASTEWIGVPKDSPEYPAFIERMVHRCEEDVKINTRLWIKQWNYLMTIYDGNTNESSRLINYLMFKTDCVREQEVTRIKIDTERASVALSELRVLQQRKFTELLEVMPKSQIKKITKFDKPTIMDGMGNIAVHGDLFFNSMKENDDIRYIDQLEKIVGERDANPNSSSQVKQWLFDLGWIPEHIKDVKDKVTGKVNKVPQINSKEGGGVICDSVKKLYHIEPKLELLEGLGVIGHRIGILEGFLRDNRDGYIQATMKGLTNTLRLKHAGIVNLPSIDKPYSKDIRSCLIANDEEHLLCGSDCSSLEDSTKQHYIYIYDPEYVKEMRTPGFDPHLDICVLSGMLTVEQSEDHKSGKASYKIIRHKGKTTNFSATYGAGAPKIALTAGISLKEAKILHSIYWERNKAVKQAASDFIVKEIGDQKWIYNPISKFWYTLRAEKDRFSTVNQSSGVYFFDTWVGFVRQAGIKISLQMHDEILFNFRKEDEPRIREILNDAMVKTNNKLKLNVPISNSIDIAKNYGDAH